MRHFVQSLLAAHAENAFLADFLPFQRRVAFFGQFNSLSQVLLKATSPGVPDFYQGTELWDFNLVDPDNRRPVDYEVRRRALAEIKEQLARPTANLPKFLQRLLRESDSGRIKLYLIWQTLQFRRGHAELFECGRYLPLFATGAKHQHVCAFARLHGNQVSLTVTPRLVLGLTGGAERPPTGPDVWGDTALPLPDELPGTQFRNVLTGETLPSGAVPGERALRLSDILRVFPAALLEPIACRNT